MKIIILTFEKFNLPPNGELCIGNSRIPCWIPYWDPLNCAKSDIETSGVTKPTDCWLEKLTFVLEGPVEKSNVG